MTQKNNRINIGLFNDSYPPIMDGVALTVKNSALWLNRMLGNVTVYTPYVPKSTVSDEEFVVNRYPSIPTPKRKPYRTGLPWIDPTFMWKFGRQNFSIAHAHSPFSSGLLALQKSKQQNIPLVATFHSKFKDDFLQATGSETITNFMVEKIINFYNKADEVWIPQAHVEDTIREYGYKGKVVVMPNGVDIEGGSDMEKMKMNAKQTLGLDNGKPILLFVGQHILEKNLRFLIKSLAACDIDYSAHFIGEGYARKELEEMVKLFGLSHKITFWGVVRERELLKRFYAAADLFLFPSRYDNAPLVVREAAAMGTPSLLLENSTSAEVVENGINGYISEENIRTYAKQISDIVRNPNNLNIGINASKTICRSWEDITSETIDRYNFLMIKKSSKRFQHIIGLNS